MLNIATVGTGFIGGAIADAIIESKGARLAAVCSRSQATADAFVAARDCDAAAVEGTDAMLARDDVDAVFIGTPTVAKEDIAMKAVAAGKHLLVDKPFANEASLKRMADACHAAGLVFMDGTHFVHNPRTAAIKAAIPGQIGTPRSLETKFYFPFEDRDNIRFDESQEPTGVLGDLGWYSLRAIVEYLQPSGPLSKVATAIERDPGTGSVIRIAGLVAFESGETSGFDCGFTCGSLLQDFSLLGTSGVMVMQDFVLDFGASLVFQDPAYKIGYTHRTGVSNPDGFTYTATPAAQPQAVMMIEDFAAYVAGGRDAEAKAHVEATLKTQRLLDAVWKDVTGG